MRALQILFLLSFAVSAAVIPYVIFSRIEGVESNNYPIILIAVIFAVNGIFIVRKLIDLKKETGQLKSKKRSGD